MNHYSQADYEANPGKYKLFRTATLAVDIPNSELKKGRIVGIRFYAEIVNKAQPKAPIMPVYEIEGLKHYLYAYALGDFVL